MMPAKNWIGGLLLRQLFDAWAKPVRRYFDGLASSALLSSPKSDWHVRCYSRGASTAWKDEECRKCATSSNARFESRFRCRNGWPIHLLLLHWTVSEGGWILNNGSCKAALHHWAGRPVPIDDGYP
jgi:hypothetical protein